MQFFSTSVFAVVLHLVYVHADITLLDCSAVPQGPASSCGRPEQQWFTILKNDTMTEDQFRDTCRAIWTAVKCNLQAEYSVMCRHGVELQSMMPVCAKYINAGTEWNLCEQPDLFKDFNTARSCVKSVEAKIDSRSDPTTAALQQCEAALQSVYREISRPMQQDTTSIIPANYEQFWLKMCCAGRKFQTCGSQALRANSACNADAVAVLEKMTTSLMDAFNCTTLAPIASCPA